MLRDRHIQRLASINSLEALLEFLREDLGWPITEADPESVTFSFTADELGLKEEHFPKINAIYQIRPIAANQPWGIFFIDFENRRLPVTLMRRILNALVVKKRGGSSVGSGWNAGDLLFMTTYGEEAEGMREVAFAHFHQQAGDLPTLNVLQWDALDAPAKLKTTYDSLRENLGWPPDTADGDAWREQWRKPFKHRIGHVIRTAKGLAEKLAERSRDIRDRVSEVLEAETETGPMTRLYSAFKEALIHDLKNADFADTFAQTVTYGLFSAAVSRRYPEEAGAKSLTAESVAEIVPETSPFLREVLATFLDVGGRKKGGLDFDELGVQEVVELLRSDGTDMRAILEDFGNRKQGEDPVIHFYEDYLKAYNKKLKVKRGVFYTPQPVVSYIVRSVNELLQTEFGIEDGLASTITWGEMAAKNKDITIPKGTDPDSPFVVILDPATGTATFLVEVIDVIYNQLQRKWKEQGPAACFALLRHTKHDPRSTTFRDFWNAYVPDHLLPRLYGYELMMAPYAIAHMKVGLKLGETGYRFGSSQRVRIYLTNALEPASELQARLALDWEALAHEAMAVKAVKETQRFTVVIGNPPYSGHSANDSTTVTNLRPGATYWVSTKKGMKQRTVGPKGKKIVERNFIGNLVHDYYFVDGVPLGEKNPKWLQDDYVKFLRFGQYLIQQAGVGALGMITNHGYLDNPTFRGMRRSLMQSFDELRFLDLHGNSKKKEVAPDGSKDENVFDIMQGVAVCLLVNDETASPRAESALHADVYGTQLDKYAKLSATPPQIGSWTELTPNKPYYLFGPQDQDVRALYDLGWKTAEIFPVHSLGIVTARDDLCIQWDHESMWATLTDFVALPVEDAREKYQLGDDARDWTVELAQKDLRQDKGPQRGRLARVLYRPFDTRSTYFTGNSRGFLCMPRGEVMRHMLAGANLGLATSRSVETERGFEHVWTATTLIGHHSVSLKEVNYLLPLYRYPTEKEAAMGIGKEPNLSPAFLDALAGAIGLTFESGGSSPGPGGLFAAGAGSFPPGKEPFPLGNEAFPPGNEPLPPGNELLPPGNGPSAPWKDSLIPRSGSVPPENRAPFQGAGEPPQGEGEHSFSPEDVFHYIYAVLHSPAYRSRYAEFLKIDFPRIPLPGSAALFDALVPLGAELVALHLMEAPKPERWATTYRGPADPQVEKVAFTPNDDGATVSVWLDKAHTRGFQGVPISTWNFHIGGYQVCEKWLKDRGPKKGRPGRTLTPDDIEHYHYIVFALSETIRLMKEIDFAIESHGGWPGAFWQPTAKQ